MLIIIIKGLDTKNTTKLSASDTKPIVVWPALAGQLVKNVTQFSGSQI